MSWCQNVMLHLQLRDFNLLKNNFTNITRSAFRTNYFVLSGLPPQTLTYFLSPINRDVPLNTKSKQMEQSVITDKVQETSPGLWPPSPTSIPLWVLSPSGERQRISLVYGEGKAEKSVCPLHSKNLRSVGWNRPNSLLRRSNRTVSNANFTCFSVHRTRSLVG